MAEWEGASIVRCRMTDEIVVLITGASSGIGRATARRFAREGFRVFGTSRRARPDEDVEMVVLDVRSDDSVRRCVDEVLERAGCVDVLVNNAGVLVPGLFAEETPLEDARGVFETDFFGVARMVNTVLPGMRARRSGRIINIGSLAAWIGEPGDAFYAAAKAALARYTEALRHEVWPLGLHVSLVEPGEFTTGIFEAEPSSTRTIPDYDVPRRAAYDTMRRALAQGSDPERAARLIVKVARARSPRLRYGVGRGARWIPYVKALLPQRLFDIVVRRGFGLERVDRGEG